MNIDTLQIPLPTVDSLQLGTVATFKPDVHGLVLHVHCGVECVCIVRILSPCKRH